MMRDEARFCQHAVEKQSKNGLAVWLSSDRRTLGKPFIVSIFFFSFCCPSSQMMRTFRIVILRRNSDGVAWARVAFSAVFLPRTDVHVEQ